MQEKKVRPSAVFGERLKEIRSRRGLSQTQLASEMSSRGFPLSKVAVLRIEKGRPPEEGGRGLLLDEALAFAMVLWANPSQMLSPKDDEVVWLTDNLAVDGEGLRNWLRTGDPLLAIGGPGERVRHGMELEETVRRQAQVLLDAHASKDGVGYREAAYALAEAAIEYRDKLEGMGRPAPGGEEADDASA